MNRRWMFIVFMMGQQFVLDYDLTWKDCARLMAREQYEKTEVACRSYQ